MRGEGGGGVRIYTQVRGWGQGKGGDGEERDLQLHFHLLAPFSSPPPSPPTHRSFVETRETSLVWNYKYAGVNQRGGGNSLVWNYKHAGVNQGGEGVKHNGVELQVCRCEPAGKGGKKGGNFPVPFPCPPPPQTWSLGASRRSTPYPAPPPPSDMEFGRIKVRDI